MRILIVINPGAGQPEPVLSTLNDVLAPSGIEWDVAITHVSGDGRAAAANAMADGYDFVGAYGGDGTLTEVATALAGSDTPMVVLPGGTGNALAADLGIPGTLHEAAALFASGEHEIRRVDMGRVGDRSFIVRLTVGFEASVVDAATRELKDRFGWLAYAFATLQTMGDPPTATYRVEVDGVTHEREGVACIVANSSSTGVANIRLADGVDVSDGLLDVVIAQIVDLPTLLGAATGRSPSTLSRWQGRSIMVESDPVQDVMADGEPCGTTPVRIDVAPGAVAVVVPRVAATSQQVDSGRSPIEG